MDEIFDNVAYTKRWYANIFTAIPDYSGIVAAEGNVTGFKNPWAGMCDELTVGYGDNKLYNKTELGIVKQMLIAIMRKYFLTHDVVLTGNTQHVVSIFFKESEQKELQMIQAKNKFTKK